MTIRKMEEADIPAVSMMLYMEFMEERHHENGQDYSQQSMMLALRAMLASPAIGFVFVAEGEDGLLAGVFLAQVTHFLADLRTPFCHEVGWWVDPKHRGKGTGFRLLEAAEEEARQRGIPMMTVGIAIASPQKDAMLSKYKERGYVPFQILSCKRMTQGGK